ncbi:MAG: hypothetical protein AB7P03_21395 [Kofleriaceae bacterium]
MHHIPSSLSIAALIIVSACASDTSSVGQRITCQTDPDSGVILRCDPDDGDDRDDGPDRCHDIDEDGDGRPHDDNDKPDAGPLSLAGASHDGDDHHAGSADGDGDGDGDGISDSDDCDEQEGEDDDSADLPYDVKMQLGDEVTPIADAFAERGGQPAEIVAVEMDGGSGDWRVTQLRAGARFVVTNDDCAHQGNRDIGRDRVLVTWRNADGSTETDHLDLRYCED